MKVMSSFGSGFIVGVDFSLMMAALLNVLSKATRRDLRKVKDG